MKQINSDSPKGKSQILLVDDSPKNIQVLAQTLKSQDYSILAARNGAEAVNMVQYKKPDLILLDIMMPEMDGFETCIKIKETPGASDIPIIFLTAKTEPEDIAHGFSLGAVDYITKPFNMLELISRIKNHLFIKKSREEIMSAEEETRALLHILCHDLANPIGQIVGIIDADIDSPGFLIRMKDLLYTSAQNGLQTIDLVRKMTALKEGKYILNLEPIDLDTLLDESLQILDFRIREKQIKVKKNIDKNLKVIVEKTSFINSVVNNLLTNAVKFSMPGGEVEISANKRESLVNIEITDSGIGIPETLQKNIFNIQKQTSRPGTKGEMGTGFGMPLVKSFVEMYGGSICISSKEYDENNITDPSHGTRIQLSLKAG